MTNQQVKRFAQATVHVEQTHVLVPYFLKNLLRFQRINLFDSIFETFFDFRIDRALVFKHANQVVQVLFLVRHRKLIVNYLQILTRLLLHNTVECATMNTLSHLFALINHRFQHLQILAWLSIRLHPLQRFLSIFLSEKNP